jgi:hypothetical protein
MRLDVPTTLYPLSRKLFTSPAPIPWDAPVITTVLCTLISASVAARIDQSLPPKAAGARSIARFLCCYRPSAGNGFDASVIRSAKTIAPKAVPAYCTKVSPIPLGRLAKPAADHCSRNRTRAVADTIVQWNPHFPFLILGEPTPAGAPLKSNGKRSRHAAETFH